MTRYANNGSADANRRGWNSFSMLRRERRHRHEWAEGGDAGADFVNSAVFLGAPEGRANAAAVLILCDITR
jgi:hypothetical protein